MTREARSAAAEPRASGGSRGVRADGARGRGARLRLGLVGRPRGLSRSSTASAYPYHRGGAYSADPLVAYDALIALALVAGCTERIELGTGVLVLPQRNPLLLAKQLASLDSLSDGRLILGAGAGWLAEEFAALDAPDFALRGEVLEEWVGILPRLLEGATSQGSRAATTGSTRFTSSRGPCGRSRF